MQEMENNKSKRWYNPDEVTNANLEQTDWFIIDCSCPKLLKVLMLDHERIRIIVGMDEKLANSGTLLDPSRPPPGTELFEEAYAKQIQAGPRGAGCVQLHTHCVSRAAGLLRLGKRPGRRSLRASSTKDSHHI